MFNIYGPTYRILCGKLLALYVYACPLYVFSSIMGCGHVVAAYVVALLQCHCLKLRSDVLFGLLAQATPSENQSHLNVLLSCLNNGFSMSACDGMLHTLLMRHCYRSHIATGARKVIHFVD